MFTMQNGFGIFSNADTPSSFGRNFNITITHWQENSSVWPYVSVSALHHFSPISNKKSNFIFSSVITDLWRFDWPMHSKGYHHARHLMLPSVCVIGVHKPTTQNKFAFTPSRHARHARRGKCLPLLARFALDFAGLENASCSEEKLPLVPNPDPKQYWNNWKNDMSLFSATNQETPYKQLLHNWK